MRKSTVYILLIIFCAICLFTSSALSASLLKDQKDGFYIYEKGTIAYTPDQGLTWFRNRAPSTGEAFLLSDSSNNLLYCFTRNNTLMLAISKDKAATFQKSLKVFTFTGTPESLELIYHDSRLHLLYTLKGKIYYSSLDDGSQSFIPARLMNEASIKPALLINDEVDLFFALGDKIYLMNSQDNGRIFSSASEVYQTKNQIISLEPAGGQLLLLERSLSGKDLLLVFDPATEKTSTLLESTTRIISPEVVETGQEMMVVIVKQNETYYLLSSISPQALSDEPFKVGEYLGSFLYEDELVSLRRRNAEVEFYVHFTLDREPPMIMVNEIPGITNEAAQYISGKISEKASLTINGKETSLASDLSFFSSIQLKAGLNSITIIATDEGGNTTSEAIAISLDQNSPILTVTKPSSTDWFKNEGTLLIEAKVSDKQSDIEDEEEAQIYIDGVQSEATLLFDASTNSLSGFIPLPKNISHGKHPTTIKLMDKIGNTGSAIFDLMIDSQPPVITSSKVTIAKDKILIPYKDEESGLDIAATSLKITLASKEVMGKVTKEKEYIVFTPIAPLALGRYEIAITPRDTIGNLGSQLVISYAYDPATTVGGAMLSTRDVTFNELKYGPNPMSDNILITYTLNGIAEVKVYIFSMLGEIVHFKNLGSGSTGTTTWDGKGNRGEIVPRGVYALVLSATDSTGARQLARGKIIKL